MFIYADNLIVYIKDKKPLVIQKNLQLAIEKYLDIIMEAKSADKCESILFRSSIKIAKYPISQQYKLFKFKENIGNNKI